MKTSFPQSRWVPLLTVVCALLLSSRAPASDRFHVPPPPPPQQVVKDIGSFFHRVAMGVKDVSKRTWSAVKEKFTNDEEEQQQPRRVVRSRPVKPAEDEESFSRSKESVPYRYDDAEAAEPRFNADETDPGQNLGPKVNITSRRPAEEPAPNETLPRKSFAPLESEGSASATDATPLPEKRAAPPKPAGEGRIEFGRPVPGKPGIVYPPGAKAAPENMVDVGGFQSGQLVRDPRTGKLFRVP